MTYLDFSKRLKAESEKEKELECKKNKHNCFVCPYEEDCEWEELLNELEDW